MLHFIINPNIKKLAALLDGIAVRCKEAGVPFDFHEGESAEETREIARKLSSEGPVTIVAVGGDGTVCDVLNGIAVPEDVSLGILPMGTGNDFAASAKLPAGLAALDLILHGEATPVDFIECDDGKRSMNIAGLGIDVDILERCYRMKHGGKKGKYFRSLLTSLAKYKGQKVEITVDGEVLSKTALVVAVCNGKQFGGGIPICPPAEIDDGLLDLVIVDCPRRIRIPFELIHLMRGRIIGRPIVRHIRCEQVRIVQIEGTSAQFDGEIETCRIMDVHIVHGKLKLFKGPYDKPVS